MFIEVLLVGILGACLSAVANAFGAYYLIPGYHHGRLTDGAHYLAAIYDPRERVCKGAALGASTGFVLSLIIGYGWINVFPHDSIRLLILAGGLAGSVLLGLFNRTKTAGIVNGALMGASLPVGFEYLYLKFLEQVEELKPEAGIATSLLDSWGILDIVLAGLGLYLAGSLLIVFLVHIEFSCRPSFWLLLAWTLGRMLAMGLQGSAFLIWTVRLWGNAQVTIRVLAFSASMCLGVYMGWRICNAWTKVYLRASRQLRAEQGQDEDDES